MFKQFGVFLKIGAGCGLAAIAGLAQAATLTPTNTYSGNLSWQDIASASYTFADTNGDGQLNVGETVTFTVDMHKEHWGTHRYDALKVWIDGGAGNLYMEEFVWQYDPSLENMNWFNKPGDTYSYRDWTGGNQSFSFNYTFADAGTYDLLASVMCSRDLSGLSGPANDAPEAADWAAWTENIHQTRWLQGQDKTYQLTVAELPPPPVPEPETYAMLLAGLGLMGTVVRRRKA